MNEYHNNIDKELALCICTYKRRELLHLLLLDMQNQSLQPGVVIIVDGDSESKEILDILKRMTFHSSVKTYYVSSNHGNQTYQRYLGWGVAKSANAKKILYLDDDLRIEQVTSVENIVMPLDWPDRNVVAITGTLEIGEPQKDEGNQSVTLTELRTGLNSTSLWVSWFGTSSRYLPGDVTPAGNRIPISYQGNSYESVKWLRGGAIAFHVDDLSKEVLSDDIFAMNYCKYGLCEDLIISRRLIDSGEILLAFNAVFQHPSEDPPKAYSSKAFNLGFAIAYSRRWFNDNYRGSNHPRFVDRMVLIKAYFSSMLLHLGRAFIHLDKQRFQFAFGYFSGIIYAIYKKPSARTLTPNIDWWRDAEMALQNTVLL